MSLMRGRKPERIAKAIKLYVPCFCAHHLGKENNCWLGIAARLLRPIATGCNAREHRKGGGVEGVISALRRRRRVE